MVDNPKLRGCLELFHYAIREYQVREKLTEAYRIHDNNCRDLERTLYTYAVWQPGMLLARADRAILCQVYSIGLKAPKPLDMKPTFEYYAKAVKGYCPALDVLVISKHSEFMPNPQHFIEAKTGDITEIMKGLVRYTKSQIFLSPTGNYEAKK